jgi:hypothetical protein
MRTNTGKRNADQHPNQSADRNVGLHGLSRRQFLAGAAATGVAALGARSTAFGAAQEDHVHDPRREPVWKDLELEKEGDKWIVNCKGKGDRCAVLRLVNARRLSPIHDVGLATCTVAINTMLDEIIARNRDATRHPGFIVTPHAPFLAWMRTAPNATGTRGLRFEDDPARFYEALGVSVAAYREKPTRFWYSIGGNKCGCKKGGDTQKVSRLLAAERPSPIHDAELQRYTARINAVLDTFAKRNPRLVLSLFVTPKGLFLAWSEDDDREGPLPRGAVTALHEEEIVLQALGI